MGYKVIAYFTDMQDKGRPYNAGDEYPAADAPEPTPERISGLLGANNGQYKPLIKKYGEPPIEPKPEETEPKPKKGNK